MNHSVNLLRSISRQFTVKYRNINKHSMKPKPTHLICFKQWTADMVMEIIISAMNLKCSFQDTHNMRLGILSDAKIMILQEINEPVLNMAVSKAATLLGAFDVNITDHLIWEQDHVGRIFSYMADAIFVATSTHMCVQRFAEQSTVPVLCMRSRTHASIQSMATIMSIMEIFGTLNCLNIGWLGPPHPVLNSYLLLCPMLGANIRFKCCCPKCPVSPLLKKASEDMTNNSGTEVKECVAKKDVLQNACVVIAGPACTAKQEEKRPEFTLNLSDVQNSAAFNWIFFHTGPKGPEVDDNLFNHCNSMTMNAFENMHYIAAALMAKAVRNYTF